MSDISHIAWVWPKLGGLILDCYFPLATLEDWQSWGSESLREDVRNNSSFFMMWFLLGINLVWKWFFFHMSFALSNLIRKLSIGLNVGIPVCYLAIFMSREIPVVTLVYDRASAKYFGSHHYLQTRMKAGAALQTPLSLVHYVTPSLFSFPDFTPPPSQNGWR